jgi:hypothetical protein
MFVRVKRADNREYLQLVENRRVEGKVRQSVVANLGRLDRWREDGTLEAVVASLARHSEKLAVLSAHESGDLSAVSRECVGPSLLFGRLWERLGLPRILSDLLADRSFGFAVERAVFATVLHRLCDPGSDRASEHWMRDRAISGAEDLALHHFYRAMAWLGEPLADSEQEGATPFAPRCTKDLVEEELFARRRNLFSSLSLCFFDTTSIYFEGEGGDTIGQYGHSKDHRPDLKQMVVGAVLDAEGQPICCELWPGNTTDVTTLVPILDRLIARFGITQVCLVSDRGMISKETVAALESRVPKVSYILGARMRRVKEVGEEVLSRAGRYHIVHGEREGSKDPSPLKVKEVEVGGRRYIVCVNVEQARKDAADREAILASLKDKLKRGSKGLVGNKGYRKYLASGGARFAIDAKKVKEEERYDGTWVLRTNTDLSAEEVALQYKQLWMVEALFRSVKSVMETRPIYHKRDETIRGHVFCSFLALVLMKTLQDTLEKAGLKPEWGRLMDDLDALETITVEQDGKRFALRTDARGDVGRAFQAAAVALPQRLRRLSDAIPPSATGPPSTEGEM